MSKMLSDAEIRSMRDELEAVTLPDVCNLLTVTRTADGQGGYSEAWGTALANAACRLDHQYGREAVASDSLQPFTRFMLTLPHDTTITPAYRVEHGGNTYSVVAVNDGSWLIGKRAVLEKVA